MHLLGIDRTDLYLAFPTLVNPEIERQFMALIERRSTGEPVAYITGQRGFMGLDFQVDRNVLIPRPETEWLVEWAMERIEHRSEPLTVVDVGTGSGAIAVSIATHAQARADIRVVASEYSGTAIQVAATNAARLAPGKVHLVRGDLLEWCSGPIDLLVANLPYLRDDQVHDSIAWEPPVALFAGRTGFDLYERLLHQASELLRPGGGAACEIDPAQRDHALHVAQSAFPAATVQVEPDLAGLDRYLVIDLTATG